MSFWPFFIIYFPILYAKQSLAFPIINRRSVIVESLVAISTTTITGTLQVDSPSIDNLSLQVVTDPNTYSALAYSSSSSSPLSSNDDGKQKKPLIVVLHGAGRNDDDIISDLGNPRGEHAGLIPSLIASNKAPKELMENFTVLAPYSFGKASFYQDSRSTLLDFVDWAIKNQGTESCPVTFDPNRIILFGFSDGATVAVELLTTKRFAGGVIWSYGFSGQTLPLTLVSTSEI